MINNSLPPPSLPGYLSFPTGYHLPPIEEKRGGDPTGFIIFIIFIYILLYIIYSIYKIDKDLGGEESLFLLARLFSYLSHIYGDLSLIH
jgi:hypothetical protein